ncbi:hypothetical protein POVWA2_031610 [Plasmodium ovale wallikeri]|uniref:Uncharacterized protein n=1 Tax=Plasmodium ovale wallikeri TaxID=864142 RepID=A0A1A8YYS6_PLAOA|nr:hypothetical protein POVWA1_031890 [Plasmodium ovale wallikeri]SBT36729.1 hypothetical protein POVWA2_031610 [Plasmodium ovale wallikeri]
MEKEQNGGIPLTFSPLSSMCTLSLERRIDASTSMHIARIFMQTCTKLWGCNFLYLDPFTYTRLCLPEYGSIILRCCFPLCQFFQSMNMHTSYKRESLHCPCI